MEQKDVRNIMISCGACGTGNKEFSKFCIECGTVVRNDRDDNTPIVSASGVTFPNWINPMKLWGEGTITDKIAKNYHSINYKYQKITGNLALSDKDFEMFKKFAKREGIYWNYALPSKSKENPYVGRK